MTQHSPALKLLSDLWSDLGDPNFVWQVAALLVCTGGAGLVARWWRSRHPGESGSHLLHDAGRRLVFPLAGMILVGIARLALKPLIHVNLLKLALPLLGSMALVNSLVFILRRAFPRASWLTSGERLITTLVWSWLALYITDLSPYAIDALAQVEFSIGQQQLNLWIVLRGVATVFLTVFFALWIAGVIESRLMQMASLDSSLRIVGIRVAKAALTVLAVVVSLSMVGIDMTALSVFTGALGVGLGLGLQRIASNYVSGFIILLDRSIRIGNIVQVGADSGMVTQITTRYTVLKHPGGVEFIVPNEMLIGNVVQNQTYSDTRLRLAAMFGVAYGTDLDLAMRLMAEAAIGQPRVLADPPPRVMLAQFADSSINLEVHFWIADPDLGKANVLSDVNLAIWNAFRDHGVAIPFPQREVRILGAGQPA